MFVTGTGGLGNNRTSEDHPNYSTVEIGQNTEKSPGDLRRLAVPHIPEENHQLTLKRESNHNDKILSEQL